MVEEPSWLTEQGPFSVRRAREEEQPGPPVSHTTKGISSAAIVAVLLLEES